MWIRWCFRGNVYVFLSCFSQLASLCLSLYPWRDTGRDKFHIVWKQLECAEAARLWEQVLKMLNITETTWNGDLLLIFTKIWKIKAFIVMGIVDTRSFIKFYKGSVFYHCHYQHVPPLLIFTSHNQVNKSTWLMIIILKPYYVTVYQSTNLPVILMQYRYPGSD